jgi:hypothetical protein
VKEQNMHCQGIECIGQFYMGLTPVESQSAKNEQQAIFFSIVKNILNPQSHAHI